MTEKNNDQNNSNGSNTVEPQRLELFPHPSRPINGLTRIQRNFSPLRFLIVTIGGIFLAEVIAMIFIQSFENLPYYLQTLIDASIMILLIFPLVYFLSLRPLLRHIEEREHSEERLQQINRDLIMLKECNQILVRAESEEELLWNMCEAIVNLGGYRMAWVGFAIQDEYKTVNPAAQFGFEDGYLEQARISWDDNEHGRGPTGTAIREGTIQINQDFLNNPRMSPWRESALQHGYQSSIALPLADDGATFGTLTIYASAPDAFDDKEVSLLTELAGDLSYGITALREQRERKRAEEELATRAREWSNTFDAISEMVSIHDKDFNLVRVNKSLADFFGKKPEELIGKRCCELFHGTEKPWPSCPHVKTLQSKQAVTEEVIDPHIGCPLLVSVSPLFDKDGRVVGSVHIAKDITEQKRVETQLREMALFPILNPNATLQVNAYGQLVKMNPAAEKLGLTAGRKLGDLIPDLGNLDLSACIANEDIHEVREARLGEQIWEWTIRGTSDLALAFLYGKDITVRKRAEEALKQQERQLFSIYDTVGDVIFHLAVEENER